jgi:uncharacterized protein (TIGR03086 family)
VLHVEQREEVRDMHVLEALELANAELVRRLRLVTDTDWSRPTPCDAWDVRALVNHFIGGNRRYLMLLRGASAAEVDATRTVDHIGTDPVDSFTSTAPTLLAAFAEDGAMARIGHHPNGDRTGAELAQLRVLDVAVHAWDLARAIGADEQLDPDLVDFALTCTVHIESLRQQGRFAAPIDDDVAASSTQHRLLMLTGRDPT